MTKTIRTTPSKASQALARTIADRTARSRLAARLWDRVNTSGGVSACWPWTGKASNNGHGAISIGDCNISAHRAAYALVCGELLAPDAIVIWTCGNGRCCNPSHLSVRNRHAFSPTMRLTDEQRSALLARYYAEPNTPLREIARDAGISRSYLSHLISRDRRRSRSA